MALCSVQCRRKICRPAKLRKNQVKKVSVRASDKTDLAIGVLELSVREYVLQSALVLAVCTERIV